MQKSFHTGYYKHVSSRRLNTPFFRPSDPHTNPARLWLLRHCSSHVHPPKHPCCLPLQDRDLNHLHWLFFVLFCLFFFFFFFKELIQPFITSIFNSYLLAHMCIYTDGTSDGAKFPLRYLSSLLMNLSRVIGMPIDTRYRGQLEPPSPSPW